MTKAKIQEIVNEIERLIEYKILDRMSDNEDGDSTGYYFEIKNTKESIIELLLSE